MLISEDIQTVDRFPMPSPIQLNYFKMSTPEQMAHLYSLTDTLYEKADKRLKVPNRLRYVVTQLNWEITRLQYSPQTLRFVIFNKFYGVLDYGLILEVIDESYNSPQELAGSIELQLYQRDKTRQEDFIGDMVQEMMNIEKLLNQYLVIIKDAEKAKPSEYKQLALAVVCHSFFNGAEDVFRVIANNIDNHHNERSKGWHKELLNQMTRKTEIREPVINRELAVRLSRFLAFRHRFRHSYPFDFEWEVLRPRVLEMQDIWRVLSESLKQFIHKTIANQTTSSSI